MRPGNRDAIKSKHRGHASPTNGFAFCGLFPHPMGRPLRFSLHLVPHRVFRRTSEQSVRSRPTKRRSTIMLPLGHQDPPRLTKTTPRRPWPQVSVVHVMFQARTKNCGDIRATNNPRDERSIKDVPIGPPQGARLLRPTAGPKLRPISMITFSFPFASHRGKSRETIAAKCWSGQQDSNLRPSAPKADALPGCAMPRNGRLGDGIGALLRGRKPSGTRNIRQRAIGGPKTSDAPPGRPVRYRASLPSRQSPQAPHAPDRPTEWCARTRAQYFRQCAGSGHRR